MRLHNCGHVFCGKCVTGNVLCPLESCAKLILRQGKDFVADGLISELTVRCLNKDCPYKAPLSEYQKYHENSCSMAKCNGIDDWLEQMRRDLDREKPIRRRSYSSEREVSKEVNHYQEEEKKEVVKERGVGMMEMDFKDELPGRHLLKKIE